MVVFALVVAATARAQSNTTLAEQMGYPAGTKLLIIHADDLAVAHAENRASIDAMAHGVVSSASVMVPCPWLPEVAQYARKNKNHDLGLHLTLTSEWNPYKWGPVASRSEVATLVNEHGYFHSSCPDLWKTAKPEEVEMELRAQIEKAKKLGLEPTHLDSHMGCLFYQSAAMFEIYLKMGRIYRIPSMISKNMLAQMADSLREKVTAQDVVIDQVLTADASDYTEGMEAYYTKVLNTLAPGVTVLLIHTAYDDPEMKAMTGDFMAYPAWCAPWRKDDYEFFTSKRAKKLLKKNNIRLTTWKEVAEKTMGKK
jgi:hypothetical protein